jgi:nucleotide-binding universal stress UspA family protein
VPLRVVIAYDGSAAAATALHAAARLFPVSDAYIVTVSKPVNVHAGTAVPTLPTLSPMAVQEAIDELANEARDQALETARDGVERMRAHGLEADVVSAPAHAQAWAAVLEAAHQVEADVLVCGTRGRGAFARALLGSTSSSLLHHTDVPLLVVPDGGGRLDGPVIAAYDGSESAQRAITVLGRLLGSRQVIVVHAWEPVFRRSLAARAVAKGPVADLREIVELLEETLAEDAEATSQQGVAAARAAGLDAVGETVSSGAGAWRALTVAARQHQAAVIAIGARGLGAARSALLGSVSSGLVQNAELPVLVVPAT